MRDYNFTTEQLETLNLCNFLTLKPQIYVCNVDENSLLNGNELTDEVYKYAKENNAKVLSISAGIEAEIAQIENLQEKKEFLLSIGLENTSLSKLIKEGFELLNLISFFTSGEKESKAWSCEKGTLAPDAGAKIHTDFKKGFIKAEVISYKDFIDNEGEQKCKEAGKVRFEGKEYVVSDADIITFKFNV